MSARACMYMELAAAASVGLGGHETYAYYPPAAASLGCLAPDDALGAAQNFPVPPLGVHPAPYYTSPTPQVFSENEMNMSFVDDAGGTTTMMSRATAGGNGCHYRHYRTTSAAASSRVGFRTRSAVDVLDDGFRWRKYGKKAVKSSPNPRNYYRCSVEGCGVKKRVERDRDDPRYVLTTYDGVHNHAGADGHHRAPAPQLTAAAGASFADDAWGVQQPRAAVTTATAHSSESSY